MGNLTVAAADENHQGSELVSVVGTANVEYRRESRCRGDIEKKNLGEIRSGQEVGSDR